MLMGMYFRLERCNWKALVVMTVSLSAVHLAQKVDWPLRILTSPLFLNTGDPLERMDSPSEIVGDASPPAIADGCSSVVIPRRNVQSVLKLPHLCVHGH